MRVLAALALVLTAVAVAARSAGGEKDAITDIRIEKITFKGNRDTAQTQETEICLYKDVAFPGDKELKLIVKTFINPDVEPQESNEDVYWHEKLNEDDELCVTFVAKFPQKDKKVQYTVGYIVNEDPDAVQEMRDSATFTFGEQSDIDTFECDGKTFTRGSVTGDKSKDCIPGSADGCYKMLGAGEEPGCTTPTKEDNTVEDFQYCQDYAVTRLELNGETPDIKTLSYLDDRFELSTGTATDIAVFFSGSVAEATKVTTGSQSGFYAAFAGKVQPSTDTYTLCVVKKASGVSQDPDTVTGKDTITDLDVRGSIVKEGEGASAKNYFEFGFNYPDETHKVFHAESPSEKVNINCGSLPAPGRCYGYLLAEQDEKLTISYQDDPTNTITFGEPIINNES